MVNIGIMGAGRISAVMAKTINGMMKNGDKSVRLYCVGARDKKRAESFAKANDVLKAFGSYEEMLADEELDLVYVATPHSHHADCVRLCLDNGKHVLCEKAFTANAHQAEDIVRRAKEKRLLLAEAIWTRYQPIRKTISETVASEIVGEPKTLTANLHYAVDYKERLAEPYLAGGALLDVGVYVLNFAEMVFGRADRVQAICTKTEKGVDITDSITLIWNDGKIAVLNAGMNAVSDRNGVIYCTKGFITVENINNPQSVSIYDEKYNLLDKICCPKQITGYEYEIMEAVRCIEEGLTECPSMPHSETLHIMYMMDGIRAQLGVKYPFER